MEQFTYGDLNANDEFTIEARADYKFVNNNSNHFTKDKEYAIKFRENLKYEEV